MVRQWKYPLLLSSFFLFIYTITVLKNRPRYSSLSDDLLLLQQMRLRYRHVPQSVTTVTQVPSGHHDVIIDDFIESEEEPDEEGNEETSEQEAMSPQHPKMKVDVGKKLEQLNEDNQRDKEAKKLSKILERREIFGNERFFRGIGRGIQRPQDFYERNREVRVQTTSRPTVVVSLPLTVETYSPQSTPSNVYDTVFNESRRQRTRSYAVKYSSVRNVSLVVAHKLLNRSARESEIVVSKLSTVSTSFIHVASKNELNTQKKLDVPLRMHKGVVPKDHVVPHKQAKIMKRLDKLMESSNRPIVVTSNATFMDRVRLFNDVIGQVRDEIFRARGYRVWQDIGNPSKLNVLWGNKDDFLDRLSEQPGVTTVLLPWLENGTVSSWSTWSSLHDSSNVLLHHYYRWSATEPLCEWIETPGFTRGHWDAVYNRQCNEDIAKAAQPSSLEFFYLYGKPINIAHYWPNSGTSYPDYFYIRPPVYVFYAVLIQDAIVNGVGDVISGNLKLVPYTCSHDNLPTAPNEYLDRPIYREVFVSTQFWGTAYFHKMIEVMPRIAAYVDFLRSNTGVQIHAPESQAQISEMLQWLGINPERIVTGIVRAKLVYLPQGTPCGFPDAHALQLLSARFRDYFKTLLKNAGVQQVPPRNRLLYVRRSGLRRFLHGPPIEYVLKSLADKYGLNYTVFGDSPTPTLEVTASLFSTAVIVVGPHGAGLSNIIFSEPGTVVIEGVCNEPHVNMCYQFTAHVLGLRYHAVPSREGCERVVDVLPETVQGAVERYLEMIFMNNKNNFANNNKSVEAPG